MQILSVVFVKDVKIKHYCIIDKGHRKRMQKIWNKNSIFSI